MKHGENTALPFQRFEGVFRLTDQCILYLIFFRLVEPLERVVPRSDDYKLSPHEPWKQVCVCARM